MSTETIKVGDTIPGDATFALWDAEKNAPKTATSTELFAGKKVVLFAIPGAYTPTCSADHCPAFNLDAEKLKAAGIDYVAMTAVNDAFVLNAFAQSQKSAGHYEMLADGAGTFAKSIGMALDLSAHGLGVRSRRYQLLIDDLVVKFVGVDDLKEVTPQAILSFLASEKDA
eukprot:TRINITY_DN594_c0_g1_i1.p1 TRINITY_DN594_c0_g1~~TRINITY_DN594_c0_g1_i1.p1  ORF type:complete len:170 (-),score=63.95 TRINITY_DN594_c0_g1_i1:161-670(-)